MIWIWARMRVMQATSEKTPETHATALATCAPVAAASEVCFWLLGGALTAVHLRGLGSEPQDHRGRPHRAHRHSRHLTDRAGIRAAGAAVAVAAVRLVVRPLPPDRQRQQLAAHDEPDEGPEDARAVADLVLDRLRVGEEGLRRGARLVERLGLLGRVLDDARLLERHPLGEPHGEV